MKMKLALAALLLAASAGGANAATYNISITGFCDTEVLTTNGDVVVGQSNASSCDTGNLVGTSARLNAANANGAGKNLVVGGDLGLSPDAWVWAFNLKTGQATLTGTPDGSTVYGPLVFSFTYTKANQHKPKGLPSAVSAALKQ
jgi:hypothetical protein